MDLRQLRYVDAVARSLNFTRAAAELHVAQPALSKAVANLEDELGVRLFERTSRRVLLTDAGVAFLTRARRIMALVASLSLEMDEFGHGTQGIVRMSTWYHVEPMLPLFLRDFVAAYPGLTVSIVELPASEMLDALRRDEIDLGASLLRPDSDMTEIGYEVGRKESLMVIVPSQDPLVGRESITLDAIRDRPFIAPTEGTSLRSWFNHAFARAGIEPKVIIETNEVAAGVAYVSIGLGLAILPNCVRPSIADPVRAVRLADEPTIDMALTWHDGGYRTPAGARALAFARQAIAANAAVPAGPRRQVRE